jgi:hypothetical protein
MGTADAPILRETDSWAERELGSFNLTDRRFHHLAKLATLLIGNRSQQILNLWDALPHESHNRYIGDATDPGVADQLEVKRCQPFRLFRVPSTGGFPLEQSPRTVQVTDGIDIGHKFVAVCEWTNEFLLHVSFGLANADSVISGELLQQTDSLAKQALPVVSVRVLERNIAVRSPLLEQHGSGVLALEERS